MMMMMMMMMMMHGLGVGENPAVTAGFPRVCIHTVWESCEVGFKSRESRRDGIDHLWEPRVVDCGLRDVAAVGLTRCAYLVTYILSTVISRQQCGVTWQKSHVDWTAWCACN